jgi:glucose-6-phosphate isomerase
MAEPSPPGTPPSRDESTVVLPRRRIGQAADFGRYAGAVEAALEDLAASRAIARLWERDATLWKADPEQARAIAGSLGWLAVTDFIRPHVEELQRLGDDMAGPGFSHVVVMGMGGSSLAAEVLRRSGMAPAGRPELIVLDSTVPASIREVEGMIDPAHAMFVVASKSGTTTEPSVFYAYFFDIVRRQKGDNAGENFIAITDPGTLMEAQARRDTYRLIFLNPGDVGGRFSALSYFGMVPAALMGLDVKALLDRADEAVRACRPEATARENPGAWLGAALGALAQEGRDKLTLVLRPPLEALGLWIEQLVAESTGKEGRGIIPVAGEPLGDPGVYGDDRVFVRVRTSDDRGLEDNPRLKALAEAGHPVIDLVMGDMLDLGAEFFRWQVATAIAGWRLGINPFDQPDVQESRDNTKALLAELQGTGRLPEPTSVASSDGLTVYAVPGDGAPIIEAEGRAGGRAGVVAALRAHFGRVRPGDYVALMHYFDETEARDEAILAIRTLLRDALKVATTAGYGPRVLHATGQLHKGGPDTGVFLQLTADDGEDIDIPGHPFGFASLVRAQALGDFRALASRERRALGLHLGSDVAGGLARLFELVGDAVRKD